MSGPKRLLTVGHSYVVATNRMLAHEMAVAGGGEWEVTCVAPSRYPGDLRTIDLEPIEGEACRTVAVPVRFARKPQLMRYGRGLRELLRDGWDVVHCWEEPYVLAAAQVARAAPRDAAVVYATFQNLSKRYPPPFAQLERRVMHRADGWIAFGKTIEDSLSGRDGYRRCPHAVIPPGVDLGRFRPDRDARARVHRSLGWEEDGRPVIGFLGRFVDAKGVTVLLRALNAVVDECRVLLVGGGPMEAELRGWAEGWQPAGAARVITSVPHAGVADYLNAMDVLAAPSLTTPRWREQFGRMLAEAMACGVPVVASDSGEIPYVVGSAGEIVREGEWEQLAATLTALLRSPERRAELARRGVDRARSAFALPLVARRHLEFFDAVLARKRRGG